MHIFGESKICKVGTSDLILIQVPLIQEQCIVLLIFLVKMSQLWYINFNDDSIKMNPCVKRITLLVHQI